jgi:hypothetical protein
MYLEQSALQSFVIDRKAIVIQLEQLDGITATVDKDENAVVCNLLTRLIADKTAETNKTLSKIRHIVIL